MDEEIKVKVTADTNDFDQKMKQTATTATTTSKKMQTSFQGLSSKLKQCIPSMNKLQAQVKKLGTSFKSIGSSVKSFGANLKSSLVGALSNQFMQFAALQSIMNGIRSSFSGYLESLSSANRFSYVFGDATAEATQWLDELDAKVNMNRTDIETFASTLYRMGSNMGVASRDAMEMTKSMTQLATDLQAFTGDANSLEALSSALRGEYDSIQNYGVVISSAAVEAKALAMGLDKSSESALLMARRAVLLEQCADIFGYAEGSAKTLTGQIGQLQENFRKLGNAVGSMFAPLLQAVLPTLNAIVSAVTKAFQKIADVINQVFGIFGVTVGGVSSTGGTVASGIANGFNDVADAIGSSAKGSKGLADSLGKSVKAAKELKNQLMGVDEINNLSKPSESGSGGSGGDSGTGGAGGIGGSIFGDTTQTEQDGNKVSEVAKRIAKIFEELVEAVQRFGKVASEWFGKIWNGGLKTLVGACGELLAIVLELALDGIALLIDGFSTILESPLGQWLAEVLGKGFEAIGKAIEKVNEFIRENESVFKVLAGVLAGVVVAGFVAAHGAIFGIVGIVAGVVAAIGVIYKNWDKISAFIKECADKILNAIDKAFPGMSNLIKTSMKNAWDYLKLCWDNIKIVFNTICDVIIAIVKGDFSSIKDILKNAMEQIKSNFSKAWDIIKNQTQTFMNAIKTVVSTVWNGIKSAISTVLETIKSLASSAWNSVKNTATNGWNNVKNAISNVVNGIKTVCSNAWNSVKSTASTIWNNIKTTISNAITSAKNTVSSIVNSIKSTISSGFNSAKSTVSSVFNSIKSSITSVMNTAKSTVSGAVSKIKSYFKFSWSLPKPKIPKFTAKWSTVFGVKIPTGFNITWHKDGGIFTSPTLLGNGRHGVGEAGAEAVLPLKSLWSELGKQFDKQNQMLSNNNQPIVVSVQLDGKEVARSTVNNMKQMSQLGQLDTSWL